MRVVKRVVAGIIAEVLLILAFNPSTIIAQQPPKAVPPSFGDALAAIQNAELAGATTSEVAPLVSMLNSALQLNEQAIMPSNPQQSNERTQLLAQMNQTLTNVENQADHLTATASQRTYLNRIATYVMGALVAVLGTFGYMFAISLHQRYRVKRVFDMKVRPR